MNAKWLVSTRDDGVNLTYHNLVDGIIMDCGTTKMSSNLLDFLEFAMMEGARDGDGLFLNGLLMCTIYSEEYNGTKGAYSN